MADVGQAEPPITDESGLLERSSYLSSLRAAFEAVRAGQHGCLVLIGGEAGVGKTALVQRFCAALGPAERILAGACDPLFTPRPLGPFMDMATQENAAELRDLPEGAKAHHVAAAMARIVQRLPGTIVVLEDMHWADEATLDVLGLLGRRIESIPALVIATYRDDELDRTHPLKMLLGELRNPRSIRRLKVQPLSAKAVELLAQPYGLDWAALYRATSGNPFFVTEALEAGNDDIPATVREAVLARAARLSDEATSVLEAVAIAPPQVELWLLDALVPGGAVALDRCLSSGMLEVVPAGITFRHELARLAVEQSVSPHRRITLHRTALRALENQSVGSADLTRLAHHADVGGDTAAVLRYAPAAAERATASGAHREATAQLQRALRFADGLDARGRAALLERLSYECYLTDQSHEAVGAQERAIECWRELDDQRSEGAALSALAVRLWCVARIGEAGDTGREAVRLLEGLAPGRELARAYASSAQLAMNAERLDETMTRGTQALELAEQLGETAIVVDSLNTMGTIQLLFGIPSGRDKLQRSLALAEEVGLDEHIGRAFINMGWVMTRTRDYGLALWLDPAIETCNEKGLERWNLYLLAYRARFKLDQGQWAEAADDAALVLRSVQYGPLPRVLALVTLGLVRARRGDPGQWAPLDEARALADGQDELQYLAPVAAAHAEAAWLDGRGAGAVEDATGRALEVALDRGASWVVGELAWLRRLAGIRETVPTSIGPYELQLNGDGRAAAAAWTELGCTYEAALALIEDADNDALRQALGEFQRLGATPAAGIVARRLRERGVRGLPRGPRADTVRNPAGLTARESEVLALVSDGLPNAEIATRLFLSERTVHHHVSAIFRKLDVDTRAQASAAAAHLGLLN